MSHQDLEMQFADPDWQPASSRPGRSPGEQACAVSVEIQRQQKQQKQSPAPVQYKSRRQRWLLGLLARIALVAIWVTTPLVTRAFHGGWIVPLLGLFFLPVTVLTYTIVSALAGSVTGLGWLWVAGALLLDLASHAWQTNKRSHGLPQHTSKDATLSTKGQE
jgi:hypothetical protein